MILTTTWYHETVYSSTGPWNNSADLLCHDPVCREPETEYSGSPSQLPMPLPGLSPLVLRKLASRSLAHPLYFTGSPLSPHSIYLITPSSVSATYLPFHLAFFWGLGYGRTTSLAQFFNSPREAKQMLDSKSGYVGSSPSPASYWPRYPRSLLSHTGSEDSTYSASIIILTIK